jgi:hypothetical protein
MVGEGFVEVDGSLAVDGLAGGLAYVNYVRVR